MTETYTYDLPGSGTITGTIQTRPHEHAHWQDVMPDDRVAICRAEEVLALDSGWVEDEPRQDEANQVWYRFFSA